MSGAARALTVSPARSEAVGVARVIWAANRSPESARRSTRTSKPSRTTRSTTALMTPGEPATAASAAERRGPVTLEHDVVRPDELPAELGHRAEERHDEVVGRPVVESDRVADLLDAALVEHRDPVGDVEGLLLVVGDQHRGHVHLVVQPAQPLPQIGAHLGVERAEGLVEQQHLRVDGEGPGQRHPLTLATGELRGVAVLEAVEADDLEQLVDLRAISALGRLRIVRPKATLSRTVMCLNAA